MSTISWRSDVINNVFDTLDTKSLEKKTPQANRQRKVRRVSLNLSERSTPTAAPKWAVSKDL